MIVAAFDRVNSFELQPVAASANESDKTAYFIFYILGKKSYLL
jgi:hypothetical protein